MTRGSVGRETGTVTGTARRVSQDRGARRFTSRRSVVDAHAWAVVHAGAPDLGAASDESGYGEDDAPDPVDVPDLGDGGDDDLPGSAMVRGADTGSGFGEDGFRDGPRPGRPPARPVIVFTVSPRGVFHDVPAWVDDDGEVDAKLRDVRAQLVRLAEVLLQVQRAAVVAPDLPSAHAALRPMTKAELSGALGLEERTGSFASRHRYLFVQIAAGPVPLDFFTWAVDPMTEGTIREVWSALDEGLDPAAATRRAAARLHALPNTVGKWTRRLGKLRAAAPLVQAARRQWPYDLSADLVTSIFGGSGGEAAVRLALVGRLGPRPTRPAGRPTEAMS